MDIEKFGESIFRIKVPFEDLTTSVYVYACGEGVAIIDSATYASDIDTYVIPALNELKINEGMVKYLLLTHGHGDHSGGIQRLNEVFPKSTVGAGFVMENNRILNDNERIMGNLYGVHLPGHTKDSFGFYDASSKTLMTGDCLQLNGIGKYRNGISDTVSYIASVNKIKSMDVERIIAAHEYDPLGSIAEGKDEVERYLDKCIEIAKDKNQ